MANPVLIENIVGYLNKNNFGQKVLNKSENLLGQYRKFGLEERTISAVLEPIILETLLNEFKSLFVLKTEQTRPFYDVLLEGEQIDIKVSTCGSAADNLSAPGAILYCLSGDIEYSEKNKRLDKNYLSRFQTVSQIPSLLKSFKYLILDKFERIFYYHSFETLAHINLNQNNFLQVSWSKNLDEEPIYRNKKEFIDWIFPYINEYKGYKE